MDTKILIKNLHNVFCNNNKGNDGKKYSNVWLTEADMGGLYDSGMFILNVKSEHEIEDCYDEILDILNMLKEQATEESQFIWRVRIFNANDNIHCESYELSVYSEETSC